MLKRLVCVAVLAATLLIAPAFSMGGVENQPFRYPQEENRLRTILPNGSVVFVENRPGAESLVLELFVSSQGVSDNFKTNSLRHLLEHLTALGRRREVDHLLESNGAFLTAETLRDATVYRIVLRPNDLKLGLTAVESIIQLGDVSQAQIATEVEIIRQEIALESIPHALSRTLWKAAYGDLGSDTLGDPDQMALADSSGLATLHHRLFSAENISLFISGPVDLDQATAAAKSLLEPIPGLTKEVREPRRFLGGSVSSVDVEGEALAVPVQGWNSPVTTARLAAALSIASGLQDAFVTYTPSLGGSLIVVGRSGTVTGLDKYVRSLSGPGEFGTGRSLARAWVARELDPLQPVDLYGLLLSEGAGQRPETALDNLSAMTVEEFTAALDSFRSADTVRCFGK